MLIAGVAAMSVIALFGCQQQQPAPSTTTTGNQPQTETSSASLTISAPTQESSAASLSITAPSQQTGAMLQGNMLQIAGKKAAIDNTTAKKAAGN